MVGNEELTSRSSLSNTQAMKTPRRSDPKNNSRFF